MNIMKNKISIVLVICVAVAVVLFSGGAFVKDMEFKLYDLSYVSRAHAEKSGDIILVGIDDISLNRLGKWPWPRDYFATLLNLLYYFKPSATGIDILFTEPDLTAPENDKALGQLASLMKSVCFGYYFRFSLRSVPDNQPLDPVISGQRITRVTGDISGIIEAKSITLPIEELRSTMGYLNVPRGKGETDGDGANIDGVIRDLPLVVRYEDGIYPSFALQLVRMHLGLSYDDIELNAGRYITLLPKNEPPINIPVDSAGRMLIKYAGSLPSFKTISFEEILRAARDLSEQRQASLDLSMFKDKLLIVGLTATGMDVGQLPLPEKMLPLCLVHMNAARTILEKNFISRMPHKTAVAGAVLLTLATGAVSVFGVPLLSLFLFVCFLSFLMWGYYWLLQNGLWVPVVPSLMGVIGSFVAVTAVKLIREEKEKRWIKNMFGHYVSPNVLEDILHNRNNLALGGENRELTVLFSDIRSFTTYCEQRTPEEVVSILNEYLDVMTDVILENGGTLDKYVGDEIMAIFGAPGNAYADSHQYMAVKAAVSMLDALSRLHEKWAFEGREPFYIGIGINTGIMKVGNMGSKRLFDYTVIGDEVNVGARIEALTRDYNVPIIISENTYRLVDKYVKCTKLGSTMVKGKKNPVTIYSVDEITGIPPDIAEQISKNKKKNGRKL